MPPALLQTKLNVPAMRAEQVARPRLLARLDDGLQRGLTVIAAPAGYGKTTLLAQWRATLARPVAWLSLDRDDNELARFFTYLTAAASAATGASIDLAPPVAEGTAPRALATGFLHEVARLEEPFVLVLDDYHLLGETAVHEAIGFIVAHAPPPLRLVLSGRKRPPLALARLQVSGQLALLDEADLRLTAAEAAAFLQEVMALTITEEQAGALAARCEGWAAGLQLAGLALRALPADREQAVEEFSERFSGNQHQIAAYLTEEVLAQQPAATRTFLRQTAILERFNGDLCNAVTGRSDGHELLARLYREKLFLVPLDEEHYWYRYHHLFAELLARRLHESGSVAVATLHNRAAAWFKEHGLREEAMHYALAAGNEEQAAALIVQYGEALWTENRPGTLLRWLEAVPAVVRTERPYLGLLYAWALWFSGRWSEVAGALAPARQALEEAYGEMPVGLTEGAPPPRVLRGMATLLEGHLALLAGEPAVAVRRAEEAARQLPSGDQARACMVAHCRGDGERLLGNRVAAAAAYAEALESGQAAGNVYAALTAARYLGEMQYAQGRLYRAALTYRRALDLATEMKAGKLPATANIRIWYGKLLLDWFDLEEAEAQLAEAVAIAEAVSYGLGLMTGYVELARLYQLRGDFTQAHRLLREARGVAKRHRQERLRQHIEAVRAGLHVAEADVGERALAAAVHWAREQRLTVETEWTSVNQTALTYASLLLVEGRAEAAQTVLRRLHRLAVQAERPVEQVEVQVLQVRAAAARGEVAEALALLAATLTLAEPETIVRPFVVEAAALLPLVQRLETAGLPEAVMAFVMRVERTAAGILLRRQVQSGTGGEVRRKGAAEARLPEFTPRQWDVLRLLGRGLTNQQIADELVVAESTVKTHLNHIYRRLDVHSRTEALARLQEVLLL